MSIFKVNVKWGKQCYRDVELNVDEPVDTFKMQLFSLTNVPLERQKIMYKGGILRNDWDSLKQHLFNGFEFLLMGAMEEISHPRQHEESSSLANHQSNERDIQQKIISAPAGLTNLGNTCYMNASLQCLRAIPELNAALKQFSTKTEKLDQMANGAPLVVTSLKELFKFLEKSESSVPPILLLKSFRETFPQFLQKDNLGNFSQQDAEECWVQLLWCLGQNLSISKQDTNSKSFIEEYMTGEIESTWKCNEAPQEPETITRDTFDRLPCHISKDVNFLTQGLKEWFNEIVKKNSPTLGELASYTKTSQISKLPKYLTINFVRFFWKASEKVKAKILRKVKYPFDLDMFEFCSDKLKQTLIPARNRMKELEDRKLETIRRSLMNSESSESMQKTEAPNSEIKDPSSTGWYNLIAVLTHMGRTADSGHYMAWVQSQHDKDVWWKFDDDTVTAVHSADVSKLDGGGDWHIAYLCLYRESVVPMSD